MTQKDILEMKSKCDIVSEKAVFLPAIGIDSAKDSKKEYYSLAIIDDRDILWLIPDDVTHVSGLCRSLAELGMIERRSYLYNRYILHNIKVIGGKSLESAQFMFQDLEVNILDITELDLSNVESFRRMFDSAYIRKLDHNIKSSKATQVDKMFYNCKINVADGRDYFDLSGLNIAPRYTDYMFNRAELPTVIDIRNIHPAANIMFETLMFGVPQDGFSHYMLYVTSDPFIINDYETSNIERYVRIVNERDADEFIEEIKN